MKGFLLWMFGMNALSVIGCMALLDKPRKLLTEGAVLAILLLSIVFAVFLFEGISNVIGG